MKFMRELEENNMARAEGRKEGHEAGVADGILSSVRNLMETMNLSAEKAMEALKVSEAEKEKYLKLLDKQEKESTKDKTAGLTFWPVLNRIYFILQM